MQAAQMLDNVSPVMKVVNLNSKIGQEQLKKVRISDELAQKLILQDPDTELEL